MAPLGEWSGRAFGRTTLHACTIPGPAGGWWLLGLEGQKLLQAVWEMVDAAELGDDD
jgi:hypothetical protein